MSVLDWRAMYEPIARTNAIAHGVDPEIFVAQITQESGWNPSIGSSAGAQGIAQIVPRWHPGVDPLDPIAALDYAAALDRSHLDKYGGNYSLALAAYNAGSGAVDQYGGIPPYAETQQYVASILAAAGRASTSSVPTPHAAPQELGAIAAAPAAAATQLIDQVREIPDRITGAIADRAIGALAPKLLIGALVLIAILIVLDR